MNNITVQDFCIVPDGIHNDAEITFIPTTVARPGFDAEYRLVYKNKGNTTLSGDIVLNFADDILDFQSASIAPDNESTGTLTWNYSNLDPFESFFIDLVFNVNSPVETPPVNIDDILTFIANIQHTADPEETPHDNTFVLRQTVVGSYDPNDKTCLEGSTILPEMVGAYLHYVIRLKIQVLILRKMWW